MPTCYNIGVRVSSGPKAKKYRMRIPQKAARNYTFTKQEIAKRPGFPEKMKLQRRVQK
jgi:hypothetical protein